MNSRHTNRSSYRRLALALGGAAVAIGCNAIFGIEEGHLVASGAGGDGGDDGTGGAGASSNGGTQNPDAGDGGSDTGGTSAGGTAGGGRGGAGGGGRGGTGGGAGGAGGGGGSGGATQPAGVPGEVHCGTENCTLPGQKCCVVTATAAAHCSTSCDPTTQGSFACDGSEDCTNGTVCCNTLGSRDATCSATCVGRRFCGAGNDCAPGQYCAPGTGTQASVFVCTSAPASNSVWCGGVPCATGSGRACCYDKTTQAEQCAATCGANAIRFACDSDDDCAAGSSCCESHTGLGVATGTSCVAGGCPTGRAPVTCGGGDGCGTGESCCSNAGGTTCGSTCADYACGSDADCVAGQTCKPITTSVDLRTGRHICVPPP
jgi:hypothetical protein